MEQWCNLAENGQVGAKSMAKSKFDGHKKTLSTIAASCVFLMLLFVTQAHGQGVRTIFLVRHADKIDDAPDALLSDAGRQRAECLAKMLADVNIQQIYTSDLQRTQQTAAPLAQKRRLKPVAVPLSKPDDLIEAIRSGHAANVLVVWHGGTLPRILHALGAPGSPDCGPGIRPLLYPHARPE